MGCSIIDNAQLNLQTDLPNQLPFDIAIIGAGAAGLMSAIFAGRTTGPAAKIIALDGAKKLGAKILVAGGGRCNVTHYQVDEQQYAGSSPNAIRKVLRSFDVPQTTAFFKDLGVELKREDTGKLFPTTDDANTVLNALLSAARDANVEIRNPWRVASVTREGDVFYIAPEATTPPAAPILARSVILATGGRALPLTGSNGQGYSIAQSLGHSLTPRIFPALVPLTLPKDSFLTQLSGLTFPATLELRSGSGKKLKSFTNSTLLTHFGLSGPSVLDISRYLTAARIDDPAASLFINFLPSLTPEQLDQQLLAARGSKLSIARFITEQLKTQGPGLPERLARALIESAAIDPSTPAAQLTKEQRRSLVNAITQLPLPITGDRGYTYAEVTAGGVPLSELHLDTMQSRATPNLYLCGEICDVDGRIGGFNFQWAWASGYLAGRAAGSRVIRAEDRR